MTEPKITHRIIGIPGGVPTGPITERPEGVSQDVWEAHQLQRERFSAASAARDAETREPVTERRDSKLGGVPVVSTVDITEYVAGDTSVAPTVRVQGTEPLPIGWDAGHTVAQSDVSWANWKNIDQDY